MHPFSTRVSQARTRLSRPIRSRLRHTTLNVLLVLTAVCTGQVRAEPLLLVDLLDMARNGNDVAALLGIIAVDYDEDETNPFLLQPGECVEPVPDNIDAPIGSCYAVRLRDSDLRVSGLRSNILAQLGNTDYLLLQWHTSPDDPNDKLGNHFFKVELGYFGVYNSNREQWFDLSRLPGVLDPYRPYAFLHRYYDDRLNTLYRHTLADLDPATEAGTSLRDTQRQWHKRALEECVATRPKHEEAEAKCLMELTSKRVWEIKRLRLRLGIANDVT
ncbi:MULTISPECIES: lysozyme inhibitor LprI family protein [Pseudomonas]|uniref:lysozyme inhibitor LprI family protein n=1 Tax=Pseudomonas TaxID=286 RepID=UPI002360FA1F|nr:MULTISPECIES: lysozyme inhibitor LprI family protein [Pseudomonas]WJV25549.1 lysozyme inhibitor LprI family protein [Pseudomonas chlororaphis]